MLYFQSAINCHDNDCCQPKSSVNFKSRQIRIGSMIYYIIYVIRMRDIFEAYA